MNYVLCIALGLLVGFLAGCIFTVDTYGEGKKRPTEYWSEGYDDGYADGFAKARKEGKP